MTTSESDRRRKIMIAIVLILIPLVLFQTISNVSKAIEQSDQKTRMIESSKVITLERIGVTGALISSSNVATTVICLNAPPIITQDCNFSNGTLRMASNTTCTFQGTDANNDGLTFLTTWNSSTPFFDMNPNGTVEFNFSGHSVGQVNSFRVYVYDNSSCEYNYSYRSYNITLTGSNTAPYLVQEIPDQTVAKYYYIVLNLDDYFDDAEGDDLSYFPIATSGSTVDIQFSDNLAYIKGADCGDTTAYFVASDPAGLTNVSNSATFTVDCSNIDTSITSTDSSDDSSSSSSNNENVDRTCSVDWRCTQWSPCRPENKTYRACVDYAGCDPNNYRQFFNKNCSYEGPKSCVENWQCNEWSTCQENNKHYRTCLDNTYCGTEGAKPPLSENCTIIPSCFNGVKDNQETGIDCGGECGVCRAIEKPENIDNFARRVILFGLLTSGTIGGLLLYYRKDISAMMMKMLAKKPKLKRKIYINNSQKDKLLQILNIIQARIDDHKTEHAIIELGVFVKEYFKQLLAIESLNKKELIDNIVKLKDKELERLLVMFYAKVTNVIRISNSGLKISEEEMQTLVDEISHNIYLVAEFSDKDALESVKDRPLINKDKSSRSYHAGASYNQLSNIYIALKFGELIVAKEYYKELMNEYNEIPTKEKYLIYNDIVRSFHAIEYLEILYKR